MENISTKTEFEIKVDPLAKSLALALNSESFSEAILKELKQEWGGDYQFLIKDFLSKKNSTLSDDDKISNFGLDEATYRNLLKSPKIRILATESTIENKWKPNEILVLISPLVNDVDIISGYNSRGEYITIDGANEPDVPVLIIGYCEVCEEDGSLKEDVVPEQKQLVARNRVSGQSERLTYIKCPDISAIESWHFGRPELRFAGIVYENTGGKKVFDIIQKPKRKKAKKGYSLNSFLYFWYFDLNHGPDYYIQVIEVDDSGTSYKLNIGVTAGIGDSAKGSASVEISYKKQDKLIHGQLIHKNDPEPFLYNSSDLIHFKISNQ